MQNLRRLGGGAGILAGVAAAWQLLGAAVIMPSTGLSMLAQDSPHKYLVFAGRHQALVWTVHILGGLMAPLLALVLLLALADRLREDAPERSQIALALGIIGVIGFTVGAFLKETGLGSLVAFHATNRTGAAIAFYAVNGSANSFLSMGDVALGLGALGFGSIMLGMGSNYGHIGFLSVITGTPLILSGFVPNVTLTLITSVLTIAWLAWNGTLLWMETMPRGVARRTSKDGREELRVMSRRA
jgi:hypothetical protein